MASCPSETVANSNVTGVILCGGTSRRMGGGDKPLLEAGGRMLLQHVIDRAAPQVHALVLSCGKSAERYRTMGLPLIMDKRGNAGPLAGIDAVLARIDSEFLFVCPGDAPRFPANIVKSLLDGIIDAEVAYARTEPGNHQLFLLIRSSAATALADWLDDGGRTVAGWLGHMHAIPVDFTDKAAFININTPRDLDAFNLEIADENQDS